MKAPINPIKAAIRKGVVQQGIWLNTGSPVVAQIAGQVGFDWCLIDAEHGPNTITEWLPQLQALDAAGTTPVIRIAQGDHWMVKQVLDLGCQTIMVPVVNTPDHAAAMAAAMRYPPEGNRGMGAAVARATDFGRRVDYLDNANDEVCLIVQIETVEAVQNIEAIAAIDGVDCLFIGPADLAADMGYTGQGSHPKVQAMIDDALTRIVKTGKAAGFLTFDPAMAVKYRDMGVTFLGVGGDVAIMRSAFCAVAAAVKP